MLHFKVEQFDHDVLRNNCTVGFTFAINENDAKTFRKSFDGQTAAVNYLNAEMRSWFLGVLDDFVNHKRIIIEAHNHNLNYINNNREFHTKQLTAIQTIDMVLHDFHHKMQSLGTILTRVSKGIAFFENILPNENNPSYNTSVQQLEQIKNFIKQASTYPWLTK